MTTFSNEEVTAAKETRNEIIKSGVSELKSVYMAGEIVMWSELNQETSQLQSRIKVLEEALKQVIDYLPPDSGKRPTPLVERAESIQAMKKIALQPFK